MLWENARYKEKKILDDLKINFKILNAYSIKWKNEEFNKNLSRFYGENLPINCHKHLHVGDGAMSLYIVEDSTPVYKTRKTSNNKEEVNINIFDKKQLYREWTGGGHKIHSSNNIKESKADILLLTGKFYEEINNKHWDGEYEECTELTGNKHWDTINQIFEILNARINYVVLRNFECLPNNYYCKKHGDIDLLVEELNETVHLLNAEKVFSEEYRVHYKIKIGKEDVLFDFRYIGDKYYCSEWGSKILKKYDIYNCVKVPNEENYIYSLLYHALIHKPSISDDYKDKMYKYFKTYNTDELIEKLNSYLTKNKYYITDPIDQSVFYNYKYAQEINIKRVYYSSLIIDKRIIDNNTYISNRLKNSIENNRKILRLLNIKNKKTLFKNLGVNIFTLAKITKKCSLTIFEKDPVNYEIAKQLKKETNNIHLINYNSKQKIDFRNFEIALIFIENILEFSELIKNVNLKVHTNDIYIIINKEIIDYIISQTNYKFDKIFLCNYNNYGFSTLIHFKDQLLQKDIGINCPYYIINLTNKGDNIEKESIWFSSLDRNNKFRTESIKINNTVYKRGNTIKTDLISFNPNYNNRYYPQTTLEEKLLREQCVNNLLYDLNHHYSKIDYLKRIKLKFNDSYLDDFLIDGKLIDAVPKNIKIDNSNYILFDKEWQFNIPIPLSYLKYRSLLTLICNNTIKHNITKEHIYELFNKITSNNENKKLIDMYNVIENCFQNFVITGNSKNLSAINFNYE